MLKIWPTKRWEMLKIMLNKKPDKPKKLIKRLNKKQDRNMNK